VLDLDEALERFHKHLPIYGAGLVNHGPMAVEALFAIGHPVLSQGLVDVYLPRLRPRGAGVVLEPPEQALALGRPERFDDWVATLSREFARGPVEHVLRRRLGEWIDGAFSATGHALLRTAHAYRGFLADATQTRREELAHALAFWAAHLRRFDVQLASEASSDCSFATRLTAVDPLPDHEHLPESFEATLELVDRHAAVLRPGIEPPAPQAIGAALHARCVDGARRYLAAVTPRERFAYLHAITLPAALRLLLDVIAPEDQRRALLNLDRSLIALHLISGSARRDVEELSERELGSDVLALAESSAELRYRAACSLDEHVIKLAEACLREAELEPDPWLHRAAAHAALHLAGMQIHV